MVKCLPAMWETWVQSLCWEDPLEKEMATHYSTFAWKIQQTEEPCRLQSIGVAELDMTQSFMTLTLWKRMAIYFVNSAMQNLQP